MSLKRSCSKGEILNPFSRSTLSKAALIER
jgi:hypothetical protein